LYPPDVRAFPAMYPIAVLFDPLVVAAPELYPTYELFPPEEFEASAPTPTKISVVLLLCRST